MKIIYVAKHGSGGNDDEGAIAFALRKLGHEVVPIFEHDGKYVPEFGKPADLLLCHHWHDFGALHRVKIPKVCWCFDLIDWPEPAKRHAQRREWAARMLDACDLCFFTDGDWVARDRTGKARWLPQGADERETAEWTIPPREPKTDLLYVGGLGYGRDAWVAKLRERYGERFRHVDKGCHGSALKHEVDSAKIVLCPPQPVTDRYWSNRVYNMLRFGAFVMHQWSDGLHEQFGPGTSVVYYGGDSLFSCIDGMLCADELLAAIKAARRLTVARIGRGQVMCKHTYRHRCEQLIAEVQKWLR